VFIDAAESTLYAGRMKLSAILAYFAAGLTLVGALGFTFTSFPEVRQHFFSEPNSYWFNRLTANLILGGAGLYLGALVLGFGARMLQQSEAAVKKFGGQLLLIGALPRVVSLISLPLLTPEDWPHMIIHGFVVLLVGVSVWLSSRGN
jgi:hypothetical protein